MLDALADIATRIRYAWNDHRLFFGGTATVIAVIAALLVGYSAGGGGKSEANRVSTVVPETTTADVVLPSSTPSSKPLVTAAPTIPPRRPTAMTVVDPTTVAPKPAYPVSTSAPLTPVVTPTVAAPTTVTVRGSLTMYNSIPLDIDPKVSCDQQGLRLRVKNNEGAIASLAQFRAGRASDVERDDYAVNYDCTYSYSVTLPLSSPVYTFDAYYEQIDRIEPWTTTVSTTELQAGKAPSPYLSFCLACG